jgi:hypothetical protein
MPKQINNLSTQASVSVRKWTGRTFRTTVGELYPCHLLFGMQPISLIWWDPKDPLSQAAAMVHRFACEMPTRDAKVMCDFWGFATHFVRKEFPRLRGDEDLSVEHWLSQVHFNEAWKQGIREAAASNSISGRDLEWETFIKGEGYEDWKYPRAINGPSKKVKGVTGPVAHAMDEKLFELPYFVKHLDVAQRPALLQSRFGLRPVSGTDFSSMEAHHFGVYNEFSRFWQHWVAGHHPDAGNYFTVFDQLYSGTSVCRAKHVLGKVHQRLMSGRMTTSSENGALNLVLLKFLTLRTKYPTADVFELYERHHEVEVLCEGDDGIFDQVHIDPQLITAMGLKLKIDHYPSYETASFCGVVCTRDTVVTNPIKFLQKFSMLPAKYMSLGFDGRLSLLRAKALSAYHQYRNVPVVGPFAYWVLECTRSYDARRFVDFDAYKRRELLAALKERVWREKPCVSLESRNLVERLWGLTVKDQVYLESQFHGPLKPIQSPVPIDKPILDFCLSSVGAGALALEVPREHVPAVLAPVRNGGEIGTPQRRPRTIHLRTLRVPVA